MKTQDLNIVLDEDMLALLSNIGELDKIEKGEAHCLQCGTPVTVATIQIIIPLPSGGWAYVCNNSDCVNLYTKDRGEL